MYSGAIVSSKKSEIKRPMNDALAAVYEFC